MTVITETTLKSGQEATWDAAFKERLADARQQPGWVGLVLLIPEQQLQSRVVVGTWQSKQDWERWHTTEPFKRTRKTMDAATENHGEDRWFNVVKETF